ncbi:protein kinase-like domain, Concanavalin A-like lectin/glucanase domain protein [Artemisia annua]|uniref:Protein kinase-like domain, Concanavalin A-like lectin/glucanase domain protein n=1 Tax=Artemisia annua TaxID=35608 RepID=A0A2U1NNJ4_ARTAN|nr:protein kinase-like domain, Concanavalin A-like lectin/glucanase domain protein [Artemisia annua]
MEDRTANIIAITSIINLITLIIITRIIFHLTEPFFLVLGASPAGIIAIAVIYILRFTPGDKYTRLVWLQKAKSFVSRSVFKGRLCDGTEIVVKRIQHGEEKGGKEFRSEIAAIASVQHLNLVRLFGCCVENNNVYYLAYDFIPNGSLGNWIYSSSRGFLLWKQRLKVACDVAKALAYLHHDCRSKVLHLDVFNFRIVLVGARWRRRSVKTD